MNNDILLVLSKRYGASQLITLCNWREYPDGFYGYACSPNWKSNVSSFYSRQEWTKVSFPTDSEMSVMNIKNHLRTKA